MKKIKTQTCSLVKRFKQANSSNWRNYIESPRVAECNESIQGKLKIIECAKIEAYKRCALDMIDDNIDYRDAFQAFNLFVEEQGVAVFFDNLPTSIDEFFDFVQDEFVSQKLSSI